MYVYVCVYVDVDGKKCARKCGEWGVRAQVCRVGSVRACVKSGECARMCVGWGVCAHVCRVGSARTSV